MQTSRAIELFSLARSFTLSNRYLVSDFTVSLGTYEDAPAIALYDTVGNVTDVYVRSE